MEREIVRRHFDSIGAKVRFRDSVVDRRGRVRSAPDGFSIDIIHEKRGSIFDILVGDNAPEFEVLQARPKERHLLLYARDGQRFLCGHDERDWFVAAVPKRVSTVRDAKLALMPPAVQARARRLPPSATATRRNGVFRRQGEWFFVPVDREFPEALIHRNEPIQRTAGSKPHICEELYREGGVVVFVVRGRAYSEGEYRRRRREDRRFGLRGVQRRVSNPKMYARGHVRHPDHATIHLSGWHRVYINGELVEQTSVAFLD